MIRIDIELFDNGVIQKGMNFFSKDELLMRRVFFDQHSNVVADCTYEYDERDRCISGVVMNSSFEKMGTYEHIYEKEMVSPKESIERDSEENILNRIVYKFGEDNNPIYCEFFDQQNKIGYGKLIYDGEGKYIYTQCYDKSNQLVESISLSRIKNMP